MPPLCHVGHVEPVASCVCMVLSRQKRRCSPFLLLLTSLEPFSILCFLYWRALGNLGMAHTKKLFPTFDHPSCPSNNLSWVLLPGNPFQDESTRMVCSSPGRGSYGCACTKRPYSAVLCCYSWLLIQQFLMLVFFSLCLSNELMFLWSYWQRFIWEW